MGIGDDLVARGFRTGIRAPHERIREKEPLARSQPVGVGRVQGLAASLINVLQRQERQMQSAVVCGIFTSGELTFLLYTVLWKLLGVLVDDALIFLFVMLRVFRGPPVAQIAFGVELTPLIVEAMDRFVPDYRSDAAQVRGIVLSAGK